MSDVTPRFTTGAPQNLEERFAGRAAHMQPSEIRSLFAVHLDLKLFLSLVECQIFQRYLWG